MVKLHVKMLVVANGPFVSVTNSLLEWLNQQSMRIMMLIVYLEIPDLIGILTVPRQHLPVVAVSRHSVVVIRGLEFPSTQTRLNVAQMDERSRLECVKSR